MPRLPLLLASLLLSLPAGADTLRVAVAANALAPLQALAPGFEAASGHSLQPIPGATGKLYAQIRAGAPFDAFLAADAETPARLEAEGRAVAGTRQPYAIGALVLWSPLPGRVAGDAALREGRYTRLALANPRLAPYGRAARAVLQRLGVWDRAQDRLVLGENIAQAFQFVDAGGAELGLVAKAQVWRDGRLVRGSAWEVPAGWHAPLIQEAVLLKDSAAGRALLAHLASPAARRIFQAHGYGLPPEAP